MPRSGSFRAWLVPFAKIAITSESAICTSRGRKVGRRAAICEECRGYVKMLATLGPLSPLHLLVADVATLHLDLIAAERGYAPPGAGPTS